MAGSLQSRQVRVIATGRVGARTTCKAWVGTSFVVPGATGSGTRLTRVSMTAGWAGKATGLVGLARVRLVVAKATGAVLGSTVFTELRLSTNRVSVESSQQDVSRSLVLRLARGTTVRV